jgi:hypothetical protein
VTCFWKSAAPETIVEILYVIKLVSDYHSAHVPLYEIYLILRTHVHLHLFWVLARQISVISLDTKNIQCSECGDVTRGALIMWSRRAPCGV